MIDDGNSFHHVGSVFIGTLLSCFVSCSGVSQDIYRFLRRKHSLTYRCRAHSITLILRSMRQLLVCFDTGLSFQCGMESTVRILGDYSPPTLKEHISISYSISYMPPVRFFSFPKCFEWCSKMNKWIQNDLSNSNRLCTHTLLIPCKKIQILNILSTTNTAIFTSP